MAKAAKKTKAESAKADDASEIELDAVLAKLARGDTLDEDEQEFYDEYEREQAALAAGLDPAKDD